MEDLERYKLTKNITKKSVSQPNYRAYDYQDVQLKSWACKEVEPNQCMKGFLDLK